MDTIQKLKYYGFFACPLNNGDWIVGKASQIYCQIYSMNIGDDHYTDPYLSINPNLDEAIKEAISKFTLQDLAWRKSHNDKG